jgi:hypothetical protein
LNHHRFESGVTLLADGKVLVAGGLEADFGDTDAKAELFRWW